ncbi:radical SAM protein [Sinorhizobium meliloti]|uniref:radical SAM protein n=1 Tax=Rhizobium meliloti TaxID=382 RepID=UPI000FD85707|nr:radical SAM protein [Sinorhizobium meliloti]RVI63890.1 radical SAM protein [Sinorhizobium meliloti]
MTALQLSTKLRYRREQFGCVISCDEEGVVRKFNRSAAFILEQYLEPRDEPAVPQPLSDRDVRAFIAKCREEGILVEETGTRDPILGTHNLDVTSFDQQLMSVPIGLEIELTRRCLRKCTYCAYESHPRFEVSGELSASEWIEQITLASRRGVFAVRFTGGDPLLKDDFFDILEAADRLRLIITIGSDFTALTANAAEKMAALSRLAVVQTTLDGPTPIIADEQRGKGNFAKVVDGAALLRKYNIPFIVGMVVTNKNYHLVAETSRLCEDLGASRFLISPIYAAGRANSVMSLAPSTEEMKVAWDQYTRSSIAFNRSEEVNSDPIRLQLSDLLQPSDTFMRIDPYGFAYPSIKLPETQRSPSSNIREHDLIEVWRNSPILGAVRALPHVVSSFGPMVSLSDAIEALGGKHAGELQ